MMISRIHTENSQITLKLELNLVHACSHLTPQNDPANFNYKNQNWLLPKLRCGALGQQIYM